MELTVYSHKNALEIIEHRNFVQAYEEIKSVLRECPLIRFRGKAVQTRDGEQIGNTNLDVVQTVMNLYCHYKFLDLLWTPQPAVIEGTELKADFRKTFNSKVFQIEMQFGNVARWYSDVFKFLLASSVGQTDIGILIVPMQNLANRMDSNVTYYERCIREITLIQSLLHLPILIIGMTPSTSTRVIDLDEFGFEILRQEVSRKKKYQELKKGDNIKRIVQAIVYAENFASVNEQTPIRPAVSAVQENDEENDNPE